MSPDAPAPHYLPAGTRTLIDELIDRTSLRPAGTPTRRALSALLATYDELYARMYGCACVAGACTHGSALVDTTDALATAHAAAVHDRAVLARFINHEHGEEPMPDNVAAAVDRGHPLATPVAPATEPPGAAQ